MTGIACGHARKFFPAPVSSQLIWIGGDERRLAVSTSEAGLKSGNAAIHFLMADETHAGSKSNPYFGSPRWPHRPNCFRLTPFALLIRAGLFHPPRAKKSEKVSRDGDEYFHESSPNLPAEPPGRHGLPWEIQKPALGWPAGARRRCRESSPRQLGVSPVSK